MKVLVQNKLCHVTGSHDVLGNGQHDYYDHDHYSHHHDYNDHDHDIGHHDYHDHDAGLVWHKLF